MNRSWTFYICKLGTYLIDSIIEVNNGTKLHPQVLLWGGGGKNRRENKIN